MPDDDTALVAFLAGQLQKPVLIEGRAGVGKTEFARAVAAATSSKLIRLQCYEGLDESRALYEWNYRKQLLHIQADGGRSGQRAEEDIFGREYLVARPLLEAISTTEPTVLLIDEVDKADPEFEALLLELLGDFAISIPELGTVSASRIPLVVLTSNDTRELSEALKRRCLHLYLDYPSPAREREIIAAHLPRVRQALADQVIAAVGRLRGLDLRKSPSVSETLDWLEALERLAEPELTNQVVAKTVPVFLKHRSDREHALAELTQPEA